MSADRDDAETVAYTLPAPETYAPTEVMNILRTRPVVLRVSSDGTGAPMEHGWSDGAYCFAGRVLGSVVTGTDALDILADHLASDALLVQWVPYEDSERFHPAHSLAPEEAER